METIQQVFSKRTESANEFRQLREDIDEALVEKLKMSNKPGFSSDDIGVMIHSPYHSQDTSVAVSSFITKDRHGVDYSIENVVITSQGEDEVENLSRRLRRLYEKSGYQLGAQRQSSNNL